VSTSKRKFTNDWLVMDDLLGLHMYDINIGRLNEPFLKAGGNVTSMDSL
jgi:hypothetical protein